MDFSVDESFRLSYLIVFLCVCVSFFCFPGGVKVCNSNNSKNRAFGYVPALGSKIYKFFSFTCHLFLLLHLGFDNW